MTDYIVKNNFLMIDFDGSPTRWAHFGPDDLNHNRSWSDERGVNAVEMLSMLVTSVGANSRLSNPDAARVTRLTDAWATLTNSTNGYLNNLVNLKIESAWLACRRMVVAVADVGDGVVDVFCCCFFCCCCFLLVMLCQLLSTTTTRTTS